jgi:hypothetical protein
VQERDRRLMQILSLLRVLDRKQAAQVAGFHSPTRANARLLKLTRAGMLKRFFFVGVRGGKRSIYCLSKKGAELIGAETHEIYRPPDSFLLGDRFIAHQLTINEVYCAARNGYGATAAANIHWRVFLKQISESIAVIPDAYFEIHSNEPVRPMFLEVDRGTEGLPVWNKKVKEYLHLAASGEFERIFEHPRFAVLVVTGSERRMQSLRKEVSNTTSKLFYFSTFEKISAQGFWSAIWLRPLGDQPQQLI